MEIRDIGQIIKPLRESKKMTQLELAEDICSDKELLRFEKGNVTPSLVTFWKDCLPN